jgi:hypothetical protein
MSDPLPGGAQIPVEFTAGQPLTETELNTLQQELLQLILTHTHGGNELASPQGPKLGSEAIKDDNILGRHIASNAITRGHIAAGEVGSSEIGEHQVADHHLADNAVVTRTIAKSNVTLEKLADEVLALLNAPKEGATTYGYFAWLDGQVAYPNLEPWYGWLTDPAVPVRAHDLPILRMRDDGGWQPIEVIMPPGDLKGNIIGNVSQPVVTAATEAPVTMAAEETLKMTEMDTQALASEAPALREYKALATSLPISEIINVPIAPIGSLVPLPIHQIISQPIRIIRDPRFTIPIHIDTPAGVNVQPTEDLTERNRVAMEVNPEQIGWDVGVQGNTVFHPGAGSNRIFNDANEQIEFRPDRQPSNTEMLTIDRMLYNYDIPQSAEEILRVDKGKIYDFLNNPHQLPSGYWTGATQNVRSVVRMLQNDREFVRIKFNVAYNSANYAVLVTPEFDRKHGLGFFPAVLQRAKDYVDISFMTTQNQMVNKVNFNLAIHGELAES